jgi:type I restriction enzyme S subunit
VIVPGPQALGASLKVEPMNLITEHIATWTCAEAPQANGGRGRGRGSNGQSPHGIKKLRELILELAVRGKLVPQDPNDEPASALLEKIAKEKARLIKDGKIKKQKPLAKISEDEKTFELPVGWVWVRLQDISTYIQRGKGPKYADQGSVRVVSQKCIQWSGFDIAQARFIDDSNLIAYQPERFLSANDLLWNSTGTGTVGRINVLKDVEEGTLVADSHVTVIRPLQICSDFLSCYIAAPGIQQRIEPRHEKSLVSGTTNQVELNTSNVQSLVVPVSPLAEQHRIVAKVDELMALCDKLEQQQTDSNETHQTLVETLLTTLTTSADQADFAESWQRIEAHFDTTEESIDQLKPTILQLAVMGKLVEQDPNDEPASTLLKKIVKEKAQLIKEGKIKKQKPLPEITEDEKPFGLPVGWVWCRLQEMVYLLGDGLHGTPEYTPNERYYFVNGNNLSDGQIVIKPETKTVAQDQYDKYKKDLRENTVLVSINGTLGNVAFYKGEKIVLGKSACYFNLAGDIYKHFIKVLIEAPCFMEYALKSATGSTIKNLGLKAMNNLPVALPPKEEQRRIVTKVDELMALCDTLKDRLHDTQITQVQLADAIVEQAVA